MKKRFTHRSSYFFITAILFLNSCSHKPQDRLFTQLSAAESGIFFNNDIHDNDSSHSFINEFGYMGGGVGIGDFNNDGLEDIFFTGNQVSSRLYINKGNSQFDDITEKEGVVLSVTFGAFESTNVTDNRTPAFFLISSN